MLLFRALLAVVFAYVRGPSWAGLAAVAAASGALALTHPPHVALVVIVLAGFLLVARALLARQDVGPLAAGAGCRDRSGRRGGALAAADRAGDRRHNPGAGELHRAFANYRNELDVFGLHRYRLKPELFGRAGAVSVAAIALLPFAVFARRRLWAAFALGGMLAAYAVSLLVFVFPHFADAVSLSQARRIVGFSPREVALVGAAFVLARLLGVFVLPVGLAAGIALQLAFPGDFERPFRHAQGAPGWLTWASFAAAGLALAVGVLGARRLPELERPGFLAAGAVALFVLPVGSTATRTGARAPEPARRCRLRSWRHCVRGSPSGPSSSATRSLPTSSRPSCRSTSTRPRRSTRATRSRTILRRAFATSCASSGTAGRSRRSALRRRLAARRPPERAPQELPPAAGVVERAIRSIPRPMKVLLVTMYFPPAGGGGVQRPLKIATHLPALGIETHVLAPDDPKWLHRDDELRPPTQAFVHRARYLGPKARLPSEELHGLEGGERLLAQAKLAYRRVLLPDASVTWAPTAVPAAVRLVRSEGIDAVITTSPPYSMNLIGAAVKRLTGIPWVADLRDAVLGNADRRFDKTSVRAKEKTLESVVRLIARSADGVVAVSEPIADEVRRFEPTGDVRVIPNGSDFDDFTGLEYHSGERFRITHTGSFFGQRNPRTFLSALAKSGLDDVVARFVGDFRAADREWVETLGPRRPARAAAVRPAPPGARAAARLRGEPAPAAGRRRSRPRRAERQDLRVPRGGAADPGRGSARRRRRRADPRDGRRGCRRARRRARFARGAARPARALAGGEADGRLSLGGAAAPALAQDARRGAGEPALEPRAVRRESRLVPFFFLAAVFCATFEKVQWQVAGSVFLADLTATGFLVAFGLDRIGRGRGGCRGRRACCSSSSAPSCSST